MLKNLIKKMSSMVLSLSLCLSVLSSSAGIVVSALNENKATSEKPNFNYVALGASNVNGYGIHGYNFENVYEAPFEKTTDNRYGYEMDTPGSYTTLIRDALSKNYNVNLSQIAMSSWRAEELHFLLDDSYMGDSYTDTWVYDTNGDGVSSNWYYGAALYEWNLLAEKGVEGYDHDPTPEELLATLRKVTQDKVADANLITVDIGMNNFGTYMLNLLAEGIFSNDLSAISPDADKYYDAARDYILNIVNNNVDDSVISTDTLGKFADTLAYALVGYCVNFDETMKEIYTLNPDADVVVVSIQNMMRDLEVVFPASTVKIPFGDIFGLVIDAANIYTATLSPYASRYSYADVSTNGRTEFFLDEIGAYNGNPSSINTNMKDCFDTYDGTLYIKTRIQQKFAVLMSEKGLVNIDASQKDEVSMDSLCAFHYGFHYDVKNPVEYPVVTWKDGTPLKDFFEKGINGGLSGEDKKAYEMYTKMLNLAYDVTAEVLREGAKPKIIDFTMLGAATVMGVDVNAIVLENINGAIEKLISNSNYTFDLNNEYPDGFFATVAKEKNLSIEILETSFTTALYMQFGSTVFSHPNANGYKTISEKIWIAYTKGVTGQDVIDDKFSVDYLPTEDSYYVAIGDNNMDYAKIFANGLGLSQNQIGFTNFDDIDYDQISKADLVSIGFDEADMLDFMMNQLSGYLAEYISVDARATINDFISSVLDQVGSKNVFFNKVIAELKPTFLNKANSTIDELLVTYGLADKTMEELDWSKLLNDEQIVYVELLKAKIRASMIETLGFENYVIEIDMAEWIAENGSSLAAGTPVSGMLGNPEFLSGLLGDSAILTIEIPIVDALVFAMESYIYNYVEYTVQSEKLISYINENHPETKIIILGHFNPLNGVKVNLGGAEFDAGNLFEGLVMASTAKRFAQFYFYDNTAFVYLPSVKTIYQSSNENKSIDMLGFFSLYFGNSSEFDISAEGHKEIAEQMLRYVNVLCEHEYDGCEDDTCNKCGDLRFDYGHIFGPWVECEDGSEVRTCESCGYTETKVVIIPDPPIKIELFILGTVLGTCGIVALLFIIIRKKKSAKKEINKETQEK